MNPLECERRLNSELVKYEQFLKAELPTRVRCEIEARIEAMMSPAEHLNLLKGLVVEIVKETQIQLFDLYGAQRNGEGHSVTVEPNDIPSRTRNVVTASAASVCAELKGENLKGGASLEAMGLESFQGTPPTSLDSGTYVFGHEPLDFDGVIFDLSMAASDAELGFVDFD